VGQDTRIKSYKSFDLTDPQVNDLVIRAYQAGAVPKTKIADVVNQWDKSDHPAFWERNMNSLYNAFTQVYKGNLVALPNRSDSLHSVLDAEVGFDLSSFDRQVKEAELVEIAATAEPVEGLVDAYNAVGIDGEVPAALYEDGEEDLY